MARPDARDREIETFRRQEGLLPVGSPMLNGPPPPDSRLPDAAPGAPGSGGRSGPSLARVPEPETWFGESVDLDDLLSAKREDFIREAYQKVLGREPDREGLANFTEKLDRGELTRIEVIGRLRYSREGRAARQSIKGLLPRYVSSAAMGLPLIGRLVRLLVPAPEARRRRSATEEELARLRAGLSTLSTAHNEMAVAVERLIRNVAEADAERALAAEQRLSEERWERGQAVGELVRRIDEERRAWREALVAQERLLEAQGVEVRERLSSLDEKHADAMREIRKRGAELAALLDEKHADTRHAIQEQASEIASLDRRASRLEGEASLPMSEGFYEALEDRFRGDVGLVRDRLSAYLPYIQKAGAGGKNSPILDVGCGRGEWLDLLKQSGLSATGVDKNTAAVEACRRQGLSAVSQDALDHLKSKPSGSLGAVTAFHVMEHLDTGRVLAILSETRRALAPGGLLIIEMPNPENLRIAACYFYLDPSHRHPIPKELAAFFVEKAGFRVEQVLLLNPFPPEEKPAGPPLRPELENWLYGPRDYGLVAVSLAAGGRIG